MARLYADENLALPVVEELKRKGHDVLTTYEAGNAGLSMPDEAVPAFAFSRNRAALTLRACPQINPLRSHPAFGLLWPLLNRKILNVAQLRLRFCSILATKSISNPGAIPKRLIYGQALNHKHFIHLHKEQSQHAGIIVCTFDPDFMGQAQRIHIAIESEGHLSRKLIRVNLPT